MKRRVFKEKETIQFKHFGGNKARTATENVGLTKVGTVNRYFVKSHVKVIWCGL